MLSPAHYCYDSNIYIAWPMRPIDLQSNDQEKSGQKRGRGALSAANAAKIASTRKEAAAILVERHGHDLICSHECLLHSIAVVDVDVDVEHSRVVL